MVPLNRSLHSIQAYTYTRLHQYIAAHDDHTWQNQTICCFEYVTFPTTKHMKKVGDKKAHFVCSVFGTLIMCGVANYVIFLTTLYDIIFQ